ncbi:PREDICTED: receptor-like protein kinase FERONIA [Theobroma cacao]|uniref:Receptor-like protein kinase FERONIA n=1 Tax=Theobroma cacao TaxID=3641 RepID=A0AB32WA54_THECC|nr:PREDICTED: receptor-like protein kinase FERONIA [Theobroma cacao]
MKSTIKQSFNHQNPLFPFLLLYLSIILEYLTVNVTGSSPPPYIPIENITIDCGSPNDNTALDGRSWTRDNTPKFSPIESQNNQSVYSEAPQQPPSGVGQVPFITARVSKAEFIYVFPLTSGQKFVRLYFYPTSYPPFDPLKAFFSVNTGEFTLLKNFSASLHAQGQDTLIKEFCVNVDEGQRLNLTFIPSPDISDSYAFINGIEIVSMPTNLYYRPADDEGVKFLGQGNPFSMGNDTALELMYRINVGGTQISPELDTGMYRFWSDDDNYLTDAAPSVLPVNGSINLNFSDKPSFSAPDVVYTTARTMGTNKSTNEHYKLTWEFPVDSGFNYFVRLHFCEFQIEITKQGDRVFEIFIANLTAETQAEVILWSGGRGVPTYKDYVVAIGRKGNEKKQNLSIALHPAPEWMTRYSDAILNGIEIFKLSNNGNLAGLNPDPEQKSSPTIVPPSTQPGKHKNNKTTIIGVVVGISGFVVVPLLCFFIIKRRMTIKDLASSDGGSWWGGQFSHTNKSTKSKGSSNLPSDICRHFSLSEIKAATNNFDTVFIIGVGGFGNVYKGFINGGATAVAIKRLNPESQQGAIEFKTEIQLLSQLRYLHLVSLIGYCNDDNEMILVYDFMAHGTLRDHLYNTDNPHLPWKQRLEICIGAARGLHYLHSGAKHTIIHRDVKTTNILLDEKWVAKVSDFGLSKVGPTNMSKAYVSTVVKGSFGYLDPEYYRRQQLTEKSDVYSFGVVLCEVLCARPPISRIAEKGQVNLAMWAQKCHRNGTFYQIIDPFLRGKIAPECLKKYGEVAMSCLHDEGIQRPSMNDVVWGLEFALQLQESAEEEIKHGGAENEIDAEDDAPRFKQYDLGDDSGSGFSSFVITPGDEHSPSTKDSEVIISGAVFSELRNPQGR